VFASLLNTQTFVSALEEFFVKVDETNTTFLQRFY